MPHDVRAAPPHERVRLRRDMSTGPRRRATRRLARRVTRLRRERRLADGIDGRWWRLRVRRRRLRLRALRALMAVRISLAALSLLALALLSPATTRAKSEIEVSPGAGPGGTRVQVSGDRFVDGEVSIELSTQRAVFDASNAARAEWLPEMMRLTSVDVRDGHFTITVTIPDRQEIAAELGAGTELSIWAVQPNLHRYAVVRQDFTLTPGQAPANAPSDASAMARWALLSALASVILLAFAAVRFRRHVRHPRPPLLSS